MIASLLAACGDDLVDTSADSDREPACMWIVGTRGHFADGTTMLFSDEANNRAGTACLCITQDEYDSKSRHDELNDLALAECERLAEPYGFEWNECQMDHDSDAWMNSVFWAKGNFDNGPPPGFSCPMDR